MVRGVTGNDERQGTNGEPIVAGDTPSGPRLRRTIPKKRDGREPYTAEFFDVRRPGNRVRFGRGSRNRLIVAR